MVGPRGEGGGQEQRRDKVPCYRVPVLSCYVRCGTICRVRSFACMMQDPRDPSAALMLRSVRCVHRAADVRRTVRVRVYRNFVTVIVSGGRAHVVPIGRIRPKHPPVRPSIRPSIRPSSIRPSVRPSVRPRPSASVRP
eukprot:7111805-Prymnesium_polylepis.1